MKSPNNYFSEETLSHQRTRKGLSERYQRRTLDVTLAYKLTHVYGKYHLVMLHRELAMSKEETTYQQAMDMCERRGSGIDRATDAISQMKLPAYKAQSGDDYTRITLFPKKKVSEMTREERIAVCYQHACLLYEDGQSINNQIVRERFNLNKNQTVMASRILADTQETGLIKMKDPETESKRYTSYIPYYG